MFEYRCRATPEPVNGKWELYESHLGLCNTGYNNCPDGSYCGSTFYHPSIRIPYNIKEVDTNSYLNYGITSFDNIFRSILTVF